MKYFIFIIILTCTLISCPYFDPMHGSKYLNYGNTYSLSFTDYSSLLICEKGQWSYNNVAVDGDTIYVVYYNEVTNRLILSRSKDRGSHWNDAVLAPGLYSCSIVCMKGVDGVIYIAYQQRDLLFCIVSYDGGDTIRLTDVAAIDTSGDGYTGITGHGDNIYISYSHKPDPEVNVCNVMCACSTDRGQTFSTMTVEASINAYASASSIAYNSSTGNVHIIYQGENDTVKHAMSTDLVNWTTAQVSSSEHRSSKICIENSGTIHVVYAGIGRAMYAYSNDGTAWTFDINVDSNSDPASDISMAEENGTLYAAYYKKSNMELEVAQGPSWSSHSIVDHDTAIGGTTGRLCSIDVSGSLVVVTYVDNGGEDVEDENNRLRLARSTDGGTTWNQ
jgi:hypothetical protein